MEIKIKNKPAAIYFACSVVWLIMAFVGIFTTGTGWGSVKYEDWESGADVTKGCGTMSCNMEHWDDDTSSLSDDAYALFDICGDLSDYLPGTCLTALTGLLTFVLCVAFLPFLIILMIIFFMQMIGKCSSDNTGCCGCSWKKQCPSLCACLLLCICGGFIGAGGLIGMTGMLLANIDADDNVFIKFGLGPMPFFLMLVTANMWIFFLFIQCGCCIWKPNKVKKGCPCRGDKDTKVAAVEEDKGTKVAAVEETA